MNNLQIMNIIRANSNEDYKNRIPEATKENIKDLQASITDMPVIKNSFCDVLINKIGKTIFMSKLYDNPFKFFKKGSLPYGKSIESIFVDLVKAKSFEEHFGTGDNEASSLLGKEKAPVSVEYYTENYRHKYKVTVSDEELRGAFIDENGLQSLINKIIVAPLNSAEYDEYLLIKQALGVTPIATKQIPEYDALNDTEKAKRLTREIKTLVGKFGFLGNKFNHREVNTFCKPSEMIVLVTPDTQALITTEYLASAFHMSIADVDARIILIDEFLTDSPTGSIVDNDTLAIVADENIIQFYETLTHSENFRNPDLLTTNTFLHKWGAIASCGYVNAIKIQKPKPTVMSLEKEIEIAMQAE